MRVAARAWRAALALLALTCGSSAVGAAPPATRPAKAVTAAFATARQWVARPAVRRVATHFDGSLRLEAREYDAPRPLRVWIARIDLSRPDVRIAVTEPLAGHRRRGRWETPAATTLEFARQRGVQLAINASPFWPFRQKAGEPMDVVGLAAVRGRVYSPPDRRFAAVYILPDGRVRLRPPPQQLDGARTVIPGFRMLLDDGRLVVNPRTVAPGFDKLHPRTAAGVDRSGRVLWLLVADGRQPGVSEGLSRVELAALFAELGAWDAINLDGGGSTTLVLEHADGTHRVVNTPVGRGPPNTLRLVALNLGFYLPGRGPRGEAPATTLRDALIVRLGTEAATPPAHADIRTLRYDGQMIRLPGRSPAGARVLRAFVGAVRDLARQRWGDQMPGRFVAGWDAARFGQFVRAFFDRPVPTTRPAAHPAAAMLVESRLGDVVPELRLAQRGDLLWLTLREGRQRVAIFWARTIDDDGRTTLWLWPADAPPAMLSADPFARWLRLGMQPVAMSDVDPARCVVVSWR